MATLKMSLQVGLPHVEAEQFQLPQVKVGEWAGFVFINPDPDAEPLEEFMESWMTISKYGILKITISKLT